MLFDEPVEPRFQPWTKSVQFGWTPSIAAEIASRSPSDLLYCSCSPVIGQHSDPPYSFLSLLLCRSVQDAPNKPLTKQTLEAVMFTTSFRFPPGRFRSPDAGRAPTSPAFWVSLGASSSQSDLSLTHNTSERCRTEYLFPGSRPKERGGSPWTRPHSPCGALSRG